MLLTVMNGGDYTLHSYRAGTIPPENTRNFEVPNSYVNGGCHNNNKDLDRKEASFKQHYQEKTVLKSKNDRSI